MGLPKSLTCGGLSGKWMKVCSLACLSSKIRNLHPLWGFDWHGVVFGSLGVELGVGRFSLLCIFSFGVVSFKYPSMVFDFVWRGVHFDFLLHLALAWVGNFTTPVNPYWVRILMFWLLLGKFLAFLLLPGLSTLLSTLHFPLGISSIIVYCIDCGVLGLGGVVVSSEVCVAKALCSPVAAGEDRAMGTGGGGV